MIGETIERRDLSRPAWIICLLTAAGLFVVDFFIPSHHLMILALAPIALAVAFAATRQPPFAVHFADDGIEVLAPTERFIPYDCLERVCRDHYDGEHSFAFELAHRDGLLRFPPGLTTSSRRICHFLRSCLPETTRLSPAAELKPYLEYWEREFGAERVRDCRCLPGPRAERNWRGLGLGVALAFTGVIWMVIGAKAPLYSDWSAFGGLAMGASLLFLLGWLMVSSQNQSDGPRDGGIVISPDGFALKQDDLCGQMRWEEVNDIEYRRHLRQIRIEFDGGEILLHDAYDRPLRRIYYRFIDTWEEVQEERAQENLPGLRG
jgi:hypothetical protein